MWAVPKRKTLADMQNLAHSKGGECLSTEYTNNHTKLKWRCAAGHVWWANPHPSTAWCPVCAERVPLSRRPEAVATVAAARGGRCLTKSVTNSKLKLQWCCAEGHTWWASFGNVNRGTWCPHCMTRRNRINPNGLDRMQQLAAARDGTCAANAYENSKTKVPWRCRYEHTWLASLNQVSSGSWCPVCAGFGRTTLADMRALAAERGGTCLSTAYSGCQKYLEWQCVKGHVWSAVPLNVRHGTWCPYCRENKRERTCRRAFEAAFGIPFPKARPQWLRNSRGNQMELDGFAETIGVAFEYQGEQHYVREFLHRPSSSRRQPTKEEFAWQRQRDAEKRLACVGNGIRLVEIPWTTDCLRCFAAFEAAEFRHLEPA